MKARSWTGRVCTEPHECSVEMFHRAADGVRWRGDASKEKPDSTQLPGTVEHAFLGMVEASANGNHAARGEFEMWRGLLFDALATACGVVWVEDESQETWWAGPWPSNHDSWPAFRPEEVGTLNRSNMWIDLPWGCG